MCDISAFNALIIAGQVSIIAAIAFLAAAMIANGGFFSAPGSPPLMIATSVATAAAAASFTGAWVVVEDFFICSGSPAGCLEELTNLQAALVALTTLLTVQALAAAATAIPAAIPWLPQAAMAAIGVALAATTGMIVALQDTYNEFVACMEQAANFWVTILATIITLGIASLILLRERGDDNGGNNDG